MTNEDIKVILANALQYRMMFVISPGTYTLPSGRYHSDQIKRILDLYDNPLGRTTHGV